MVVAEILGGLGNQLSAYACGYSVAKYLGQELVLDVSDYTHKGYFRPYCLDKLQIGSCRKLVYPPASAGFMEVDCIPEELRDSGFRVVKHADYKTREELLNAVEGAGNVYLLGYGGMQYCTQEEQAEVKRQFQLKTPSPAVEQFRRRIQGEYSVAVHLRRTDFVGLGWQSSAAYYQAAVAYVRLFHPEARFYFFSDDIEYAKEQFGPREDYHYVHLLGGMDVDLEEFFCISACDGRILTRQSSFSSWASLLSRSGDKLDVCQAYDNGARPSPDQVYLNAAAVNALSSQYREWDAAAGRAAPRPAGSGAVLTLVLEERNDEAIDMIDGACIDSYGLGEAETRELAAYKTIALAQKGDSGLPAALRLLYQRMQEEGKDPVFHANYFLALYQAGWVEESAVHAALANRFGDQEDYGACFAQAAPLAQELYRLLREEPPKHFIFIPIEGWSFYITYLKTLAALLARMGQKVTFFQPSDNVVETDAGDDAVARSVLQNVGAADSVYRYHVDMVPNVARRSGGEQRPLIHALIRQCAARFAMPAVVVASHPNVFAEPKVAGVKYVVPDICDPLNRERYILESGGISMERYLSHMAAHADAVFLSGPVYDAAKKQIGGKVRRAFSTWEGPGYQILDMELDFTPNHIPLKEMLKNAAELLKV